MFWMCNDETIINLDYVKYFRKEQTENVPDSKPRIAFYLKNESYFDVYNTADERDYAYEALIHELDTII